MRLVWIVVALVSSALRGLQASSVPSLLSILTIAVALVLVGSFGLLVGNMQGLLDEVGRELQVVAYVERGVDDVGLRELAQQAASVDGVEQVVVVSPEEALERFRRSVGGADLLDGLDDNPLPASLEVVLLAEHRSSEGLARVAAALEALDGVEELAHGQEWVEGYARAVSLARAGAVGLGIVLSLAALLIVANTIRLGVYAREDELEILGLVGASRTYVRVPFLLEGSLLGLAGGLLALGVLWLAFVAVVPRVEYGLALFLGQQTPTFFGGGGVLALLCAGGGLGALGSATALVGWKT
ncbi:MAG: cell division protein FtsX [Myxococcota bacterium]